LGPYPTGISPAAASAGPDAAAGGLSRLHAEAATRAQARIVQRRRAFIGDLVLQALDRIRGLCDIAMHLTMAAQI
jgi:hypothetical protein